MKWPKYYYLMLFLMLPAWVSVSITNFVHSKQEIGTSLLDFIGFSTSKVSFVNSLMILQYIVTNKWAMHLALL